MRTFIDAKLIAKCLRYELRQRTIALGHSECLEIVSHLFGAKNWNALSASIQCELGEVSKAEDCDITDEYFPYVIEGRFKPDSMAALKGEQLLAVPQQEVLLLTGLECERVRKLYSDMNIDISLTPLDPSFIVRIDNGLGFSAIVYRNSESEEAVDSVMSFAMIDDYAQEFRPLERDADGRSRFDKINWAKLE